MDSSRRECCQRERYAYALYNRFKVPKLYKYASNGDWDKIPQRCQSHPREVKFVHYYAPSDTALHRLLSLTVTTATTNSPSLDTSSSVEWTIDIETRRHIEQVKLNAVMAMLRTDRWVASIRDTFGRTPLHVACMDLGMCGDECANYILEAYPKAAGILDIEGRTPLHYLVGRNDDIYHKFLVKLIVAFPGALQIPDNVQETPLQIVMQRGNELRNVDKVMEILKTHELQIHPDEHHDRIHQASEHSTRKTSLTGSDRQSQSEEFHGMTCVQESAT
jgi:hypothetical protein